MPVCAFTAGSCRSLLPWQSCCRRLTHAAGVAYIEDGQVWVASLDGQAKVQLSPTPTDPPDEKWIDVAQGDGGQVIGVRNVPGRQGQFATFAVWQPDGTLTDQGPMQNISGYSVNVLPLSVDLTPDGKSMVYGYSDSRYDFGSGYQLQEGFVVQSVSTRASGTPFDVKGPAVADPRGQARRRDGLGNRCRARERHGVRAVQPVQRLRPVAHGRRRVQGAAHRRRRQREARRRGALPANPGSSDDLQERIALFPVAAFGGPITPTDSDCFLATTGKGKEVGTLLQDATRVAYVDDGGVKIAPVPALGPVVTDCPATTPVTISAAAATPRSARSTLSR